MRTHIDLNRANFPDNLPEFITADRRLAPRYAVSLPVRVMAIGGRKLNSNGQTQDIGACGIRFIVPAQLPVGDPIEYAVTLPVYCLAARIRGVGKVLRCDPIKTGNGEAFEVAASMEQHVLIPQKGIDTLSADVESLSRTL
jgi:hypothetical protein